MYCNNHSFYLSILFTENLTGQFYFSPFSNCVQFFFLIFWTLKIIKKKFTVLWDQRTVFQGLSYRQHIVFFLIQLLLHLLLCKQNINTLQLQVSYREEINTSFNNTATFRLYLNENMALETVQYLVKMHNLSQAYYHSYSYVWF